MTRYMLDTSVLIDVGRRIEPVASRIASWVIGPDEPGVCVVQIAEFFAGLRADERYEWEIFFQTLMLWPISPQTAIQAGIYRYDLARRGIQIGTPDAMIAAVAREQSAILVTSNIRHFAVLDIELLNLRSPTAN